LNSNRTELNTKFRFKVRQIPEPALRAQAFIFAVEPPGSVELCLTWYLVRHVRVTGESAEKNPSIGAVVAKNRWWKLPACCGHITVISCTLILYDMDTSRTDAHQHSQIAASSTYALVRGGGVVWDRLRRHSPGIFQFRFASSRQHLTSYVASSQGGKSLFPSPRSSLVIRQCDVTYFRTYADSCLRANERSESIQCASFELHFEADVRRRSRVCCAKNA
jgi:hypothetical protein